MAVWFWTPAATGTGPGRGRGRGPQQVPGMPRDRPWTAEVIAMRGLGDPDAFPVSDLGLRLAAEQLGLPTAEPALDARSRPWRPWRSYATQHLWTTLKHPVNHWPSKEIA